MNKQTQTSQRPGPVASASTTSSTSYSVSSSSPRFVCFFRQVKTGPAIGDPMAAPSLSL